MSLDNWLQLLAVVVGIAAITRLLGPYLAARATAAGGAGRPRLPAGRAPHLPRRRASIPRREQRVDDLRALAARVQRRLGASASTCSSASRASLPLNPTDVGAVPPALAFNTAVSFVTNTNWQNYGGESTMSHLTQMAGLTVQNFVSAAVGIAVAVALIRGLDAAPGGDDRQLLGRPVADDDARAAAARVRGRAAAREPGRRPDAPRPHATPPPSRAPRSRSTGGRSRARRRSRSSARTAAASSTRTRRTRSRTRPPSRTSSRSWRSWRSRSRSRYAFGRLASDQKQGWAVFAAMFVLWIGSVVRGDAAFELDGNPRIDAVGGEHGGQGGAVRRRSLGSLRRLARRAPRRAR